MTQPSLAIFCSVTALIINAGVFHCSSVLSQNQQKIHEKLVSMENKLDNHILSQFKQSNTKQK